MSKSIVHFYELSLSTNGLSDFTDEEIAAFGLLSHISNELTALSNLVSASHDHEYADNPVQFAKLVQHNVLLRTLISKVFEAFEALESLVRRTEKLRPSFVEMFREIQPQITKLKGEDGFSLNRNIRNDTSFHYDYSKAKNNARRRKGELGASIYASNLDGNSYFVLGEQLMFIQRLMNFGESDADYRDPERLIEQILGWSRQVIQLVKGLHSKLFGLIMDETGQMMRKSSYYVEPFEVFEANSCRLPVFVRHTP